MYRKPRFTIPCRTELQLIRTDSCGIPAINYYLVYFIAILSILFPPRRPFPVLNCTSKHYSFVRKNFAVITIVLLFCFHLVGNLSPTRRKLLLRTVTIIVSAASATERDKLLHKQFNFQFTVSKLIILF